MNIPFELIFIVLFFVLPALGSLQRRLRERAQQEPENAEQPRTDRDRPRPPIEPRTGTTTATPARPLAAPTRADTSGPAAGAGGWLEEAQRRVREAQETENDRRGRRNVNPRTRPSTPSLPTSPRPARAPQPTPQAARPAQTRPHTPSLEGRSLEGGSLENYRPAYSSLESGPASHDLASNGRESSRTLKPAPPLNVQRLGGSKRATIAQAVRLDEQSVMNGFIWHQILSPPLSKSRRTRLSRRQP